MNGYNLIRNWYAFKFNNPSKCKAIHSDMYCYLVDLWNRLGQKNEFGLPTQMTMELLGIGSYNTYKKAIDSLIEFGFVTIVKDSINQHRSKIVALSNFDKATDKALDKATIKATDEAPNKATDTIYKPINQLTNKPVNQDNAFSFSKSLQELGIEKSLVNDFIKNRKLKKLANTETAFKALKKELKKSNLPINELMTIVVSNGWGGYKSTWSLKQDSFNQTHQSTSTLKQTPIER
jgi:hypothetical protein